MKRAKLFSDVHYTIGKTDDKLYSSFTEHLGRCIYGGLYEPGHPTADENGYRMDVMKEIQIHPISNKILHIDFHAVKADEMIKSVVPLVIEGEAAGLRQGGELEQVLYEVEIESLPANIPEVITVDVSGLELNQALHVADLKLTDGVKAVSDPELIIAHCRAHKVTAEEAAEDAAAAEAAEEKEEAAGDKKK